MVSISEDQANTTRNESKENKQMIEELETEIDDMAETLCTSKLIIVYHAVLFLLLSRSIQLFLLGLNCDLH